MINSKRKAGKKTKTSSNPTKKEQGSVSSTPTSTVSDHDRIPVVTSLPPAVDGHLRCFLRVSVPRIHWIVQKYPTDVQVRLRWWGEDGDGVLLRPLDDKADEQTKNYTRLTCVRYAVCSGPRQFSAYLNDMGALIFEVVHGPSHIVLGQVRLVDVSTLSASTPIQGFFNVMSTTLPSEKLAILYITLRFESTSAAYSQLSSSLVPTVDMEIDAQRQAIDESDAKPTPPPSLLNPVEPIPHPRQWTEDMDLFMPPAVPAKGVKFALTSPERLEYTAEQSLISTSRTGKKQSDDLETKVRSKELTKSSEPLRIAHRGQNESSDLIGVLLHRGEKLREAMVMSADEANNEDEAGGASVVFDRNAPSGKLLKEILTSTEIKHGLVKSGGEEDSVIESVFLHNNKAVDLLLGEDEKLYLDESLNTSPDSSIVSEPGDPLHDDTLLKDLFYTTPIVQSDTDSDNTVVTDEDNYDDGSVDDDKSVQNPLQEDQFEKVLSEAISKERSPKTASRDISTRNGKEVNHVQNPGRNDELTSLGYLDKKQSSADDTSEDSRDKSKCAIFSYDGEDSVLCMSSDSFTSAPLHGKPPRIDPDAFIENLGPEKLTALGRVDAARVMVDSLQIANETIKPGTFFVEYNFPTSTPTRGQDQDITMATELTRIASKRIQDRAVLFGHRSVFPLLFNSVVIDYWWRLPLTFRLYFRESRQRKYELKTIVYLSPVVIGVATFPLKTVLQSNTLSSSALLQIKCGLHSKEKESSYSWSSLHDFSESCGPLLVKVELMADGKKVHLKTNMNRKPPLPTTTTLTTTEHMHTARPAYTVVKNVGKVSDVEPLEMKEILKTSSKRSLKDGNLEDGIQYDRDPLTLYSLLWIPEGKQLTQQGYRVNQDTLTGLVVKNNLYLMCRTFWCEEVSKSRVCWGESNPSFGFKQVAPVLLTSSLLQRVCNNFMVIEVWNRIGPQDQGDKLLGLVKLPIHQLYLSYRDHKITKTLLKSKYPVIAVDEWCPITNPFSHTHHGQLRVVLAMGSEDQIGAILSMKCGGEVPFGMEPHPDHHLDLQRLRDGQESHSAQVSSNQELIEHQFEIVVEDVRGLSVFGSTVWGETDCFVQYHFPFQSQVEHESPLNSGIFDLQPHRTPTTLCLPDPVFHDAARHTFKLPCGFPVQKHLLAAFTGSKVAVPSVSGSGGVPFELWRRYYYPNIRDQMVAKASLPLAKLCAMVTMQKQGDTNIQTFSLPLAVLSGDEMDGMRQTRVQDTGLLDVTVKYKQVKVGLVTEIQKEDDSHVCLSLKVFRACGLQAAAVLHAKSNPSLSYPAEVGVNAYLVIQFPLGKKHKYVTRTVARTFSPEFSYNADILLLLFTPSGVNGRGNLSLAEQLEDSEVMFEVWHQMSRERRSDHLGASETEKNFGSQRDVLLGVARVPLVKLLAYNTGVKGWFPIHLPGEQDTHDASPYNEINKVVGGLELGISFSKTEDRDHIIHMWRGLGWSPPPEVDCNEVWLDREEPSVNEHWTFCLKISSAWIPLSELKPFSASEKNTDKPKMKGYARYKLHNKAPIFSRMSSVKDCGDGKLICELKHSKEILLPASHSFSWHMREESLEIQLWLSIGRQTADTNSKKRDRLVGSAYVDMSSLLATNQRKHRQIGGLYPLFRSGASNLFGGCIHVQSFVKVGDISDHEPLSSAESIDASSLHEDQTTDSRTKIPYQDQVSSVEPMVQQQSNRQLTVTEASDETFMAHVIIEQALHLPTVPGTSDNRVMPNVYVSYQTLSSISPASTPVVVCSSSPRWEYQKLERITYSSIKLQDFQFKVWHTSEAQKGIDSNESESFEPKVDSSGEDRLIGSVSCDLSPLLAGMRQLIGWYNVNDFNGDCQGQIKVGISPVNPLSPPRSFTSSRKTHSQLPKQDATFITPVPKSHRANGFNYQTQGGNPLSSQLQGCSENEGFRMTTDGETEAVSSCSSSLLFSQLRHNMKELDILQQNLTVKLRSNPVSDDDGHNREDLWATLHPQCLFSGGHETVSFPLESSRTLRTENMTGSGNVLEGKLAEAVFKENCDEHMGLNGKHMTQVRIDGYILPSPKLTPELKQTSSFVDNEKTALRTVDNVLDSGATIPNYCELQEPSAKCREECLEHTSVLDSLPDEENQLSVAIDCWPPLKGEPSLTDISGDFSVSGYVQDNTNDTRFADLKDSWLSSEEEEENSGLSQAEKPGMLNVPSGLKSNRHTAGELERITVTNFQKTENKVSDRNDDHSSIFGDRDEQNMDVDVMSSEAERKQSVDDSIKSNDSGEDFTRLTSIESGDISAAGRKITSNHDNIKETFSNEHASNNSLTPNKMVIQDSLPRYPLSHRQTSAMLPNFFMPSEQLEESMRALRLGASNTSSHSKLLAYSQHTGNNQCTKENLTEKFAKRKQYYKDKKDERPPISHSEVDRIARIFKLNSGSL